MSDDMGGLLDDSRFPDRPQHPDFWRMAQVAMMIDGEATEGGKTASQILGDVDMDSLMYMVRERSKLAREVLRNSPRVMQEQAMYMDAFALGKGFAEAGGRQSSRGPALATVLAILDRVSADEWSLDKAKALIQQAYEMGDREQGD